MGFDYFHMLGSDAFSDSHLQTEVSGTTEQATGIMDALGMGVASSGVGVSIVDSDRILHNLIVTHSTD